MNPYASDTVVAYQDPASAEPRAEEGIHLDLERFWLQAKVLKYWILGLVAFGLLAGLL